MSPERFSPDDPREWLNRAKSNLAVAKCAVNNPDVFFEDLCFDCQQAAEKALKALKALLVHSNITVPRTHDIADLLTTVQKAGFVIPGNILDAAKLTGYSVASRYPGLDEPITSDELHDALSVAESVIDWVSDFLVSEFKKNE